MSGIIGKTYLKNTTGLVPIHVWNQVSTPNSGSSSGFTYGPTSLDFNWTLVNGRCDFWGTFVAGTDTQEVWFECLPYKVFDAISLNVQLYNTSTRAIRCDEGERKLRWTLGASGGNWTYYVNCSYYTDGSV